MSHEALHWPSDNACIVGLWAFVVTHAACMYNHLPNNNLGWICTVEIFTNTQSDHCYLLRTRVWGWPDFVIHPKLQYNNNIKKFNRRSRTAQYLRFIDKISTLVAMVRNLATNFVSPQLHFVFDEKLTAIQNGTRLEETLVEKSSMTSSPIAVFFYGDEGYPP